MHVLLGGQVIRAQKLCIQIICHGGSSALGGGGGGVAFLPPSDETLANCLDSDYQMTSERTCASESEDEINHFSSVAKL